MTTATDVIDRAARWDGYAEKPSPPSPRANDTVFGEWYGLQYSPWCAMFVSWVFFHAGLPLPASTTKGFAYTPAGAAWFRARNRWSTVSHVGDVVFFYWTSAGRIAHVGIVARVDPDGSFWSWEGNTSSSGDRTGGRVLLQHRSLATVNVARGGGFGRPAYSADPPPAPRPTPTLEEDDMFIVHRMDSPNDPVAEGFLLLGSGKVPIPPGTDVDVLKAAGVKELKLSAALVDAIPVAG